MHVKLGHDLSKEVILAQAAVGTGEAFMSFAADDQETAAAFVNGKNPFLVSSIIDTDQFSP